MKQGMNGNHVKRSNRGLFLKHIALGTADSRTALSKATGLAKMTAGNIVQELLSMGLVRETTGEKTDRTGPNPQLLEIADSAPKILGVYIARDQLSISTGDLSGRLLWTRSIPLRDETRESLCAKLLQGVREAPEMLQGQVFAIGAAVIGPIDPSGSVRASTNFFGITDLPVRQLLEQAFGLPVLVYNDTSASAVAEQLIGGGDFGSFSYIGISNGIGAGIVNDGELLTSNRAFMGELGHTTIDLNGEPCPCGNRGCLERYADIPAICRKLEQATGQPADPTRFEALSRLPEGDRVFQDTMEKLTAALLNLSNLFQPQAIILGHGGYYIPDRYVRQMEEQLNRIRFSNQGERMVLKKSFFRDQAALYGSICCVMREVFRGELLF